MTGYIAGLATTAALARDSQMTQDRDSALVHVARMRVGKLRTIRITAFPLLSRITSFILGYLRPFR
jgi:hypothetical protein